MKSVGLKLVLGFAAILAAACANASDDLATRGLQEGPGGEIETLTEKQFFRRRRGLQQHGDPKPVSGL